MACKKCPECIHYNPEIICYDCSGRLAPKFKSCLQLEKDQESDNYIITSVFPNKKSQENFILALEKQGKYD